MQVAVQLKPAHSQDKVGCYIHWRSHDNDGNMDKKRERTNKTNIRKIGTIEGVKRICPAIILEKLKE